MSDYPKGKKRPSKPVAALPVRSAVEDAAVFVQLVRASRGWTQEQLAEAARMHPAQISAYETGLKIPRPATREKLAAAAGTTPEAVIEAAEVLRRRRTGRAGASIAKRATAIADQARRQVEAVFGRTLDRFAPGGDVSVLDQRTEAKELWYRLADLPTTPQRLRLIELSPPFWSAALVERLAHESERAAGRDVKEGIELAELALRVAQKVPGPPARGAAAKSYAWFYLSNVRRVEGAQDAAEAALATAKRLASESKARENGAFPFSRARPLDLEATLRRDQGRFDESLALLDRAFKVANPDELGFLWLHRSAVLESLGRTEESVGALAESIEALRNTHPPPPKWSVLLSLAGNLLDLGHTEVAEAVLPEVPSVAAENEALAPARKFWQTGKVAAVEGRIEEAIVTFELVRRLFMARGSYYDAAISTLELATLLLEQERPAETRAVIEDALPIFDILILRREGLAGLHLFLDAVREEAAVIDRLPQSAKSTARPTFPRTPPIR